MTDPVHKIFGLSRANYLVLPRSVLQSMPAEWQTRFVSILHEMGTVASLHGVKFPDYQLNAVNRHGVFVHDDLADYDLGRRRLLGGGHQDVF